MKKVLFIAYHFPPLAGGGTFRSLKFVKYLPEFGWLPTVITTNTKNYWAYDESLLEEIPENVKIIRAPEIDPFYLQIILSKLGLMKLYEFIRDKFFIPDEKIGWIPFAYLKAKKELKSKKYDLIFSTSPTPSALVVGYKLKKQSRLPFVIDYRDLWTLNPEYGFRNTRRFFKEFDLEKKICSAAYRVISVTQGNLEELESNLGLKKGKVTLIYNGYDDGSDNIEQTSKDVFIITYTGTFYGERNPDVFLKALYLLKSDLEGQLKNFQVNFYGRSDYNILRKIRELGLEDVVSYYEFIPRNKLESVYRRSAVFLLIIPDREYYILTSKIFDYMCYYKPILALVPPGEAKEILQKSQLGFFADPGSPEEIKNQILHLYHLWKDDRLYVQPNYSYIRQFHRRNLTRKLAKLFDSLVKNEE